MLNKINSEIKRLEIIDNIKNFNSNDEKRHSKRLYTISFLNYVGYNINEIRNICVYYNPSLNTDAHYSKYVSNDYIQNDIFNYSNGKKILEEKPSHNSLDEKRSFSNISFNKFCDVNSRYNAIPNNDLNKSFFLGANIIAFGYIDKLSGIERYNLYGNFFHYNPITIPVYRSIGGIDHVLFVADIDRKQHNNSLEEARVYALSLSKLWDWDIIKFSGSEGFHLIKYLPANTTIEDLQRHALRFDPTKTKLDWHLFNDLNWKIRGYCVNLKTNKMSVDVDLKNYEVST